MKDTITLHGRHECPLSVYYQVPENPKAIVQIFHGMGEHKERYEDFIAFLNKNGYGAYIHDHRKHGASLNSPEELGIFSKEDTWDDVLDDCYFVTRKIQKDHKDVPIIIMGHSMGSIIARGYIQRFRSVPSKAIIMGTLPPYTSMKGFAPIMLAKILGLFRKERRSEFMANQLNAPLIKPFYGNLTPFDWISSDEAVVKAYAEDPLCGYSYNAKFYEEFLKAIVKVNKERNLEATPNIPLLFISGDTDPVGEFGKGVEELVALYSGHAYQQMTTIFMKDARHEVLNETNKQEAYDKILKWLNK